MSKKESKSKEHEDGARKENAPLIRREIFNMETLNILLSSIILVVLLVGPGSSIITASDTQSSSGVPSSPVVADEESCRMFCEFNPSYGTAAYAGLSAEGHCLCEIALDSIPVYAENKTMSAKVVIDQGIILKSVTLEDGLPDDSLASMY